jgi:ribose 5-phosphate isomerase B
MATIALACDHAGIELKAQLAAALAEAGETVLDLGTNGPESVDYPDYAAKLARTLQKGQASWGVLICGTGVGISIAANKLKGIRAALCHDTFTASQARAHNDANVLCLGARCLSPAVARDVLAAFRLTSFEGGRHARRIAKIHALEEEESHA